MIMIMIMSYSIVIDMIMSYSVVIDCSMTLPTFVLSQFQNSVYNHVFYNIDYFCSILVLSRTFSTYKMFL